MLRFAHSQSAPPAECYMSAGSMTWSDEPSHRLDIYFVLIRLFAGGKG